jgi:curved DNA-binding protein CbpA
MKKSIVLKAISIIIISLAIKMGYEIQSYNINYYNVLNINKDSSTLDIRQSYKNISRKLHPDKNPLPDAKEKFEQVKSCYDVLMDEQQRDLYNRFGDSNLKFDPRQDELKLLSGIAAVYIFWLVISYIFTLPIGAKSSRIWVSIVGITMLIVEVSLCLTESSLPNWMPKTLTEFELIRYMHCLFPAILAGLRCLSEYLYVDIDQTSLQALQLLTENQGAMTNLLIELQGLIKQHEIKNIEGNAIASLQMNPEKVQSKIDKFREIMQQSNDKTNILIEALKNSSSNPGSKYYWLLFVAMYAGIYFLN